jgi:hypothetical protein
VNLELARPECSIAWTAKKKLQVILMSPAVVIVLIAVYLLFKACIHKKDAPPIRFLRSGVTMFVGAFVSTHTGLLRLRNLL